MGIDYGTASDAYQCSWKCLHNGLLQYVWDVDWYPDGKDEDQITLGGSLMVTHWCPEGEQPDENLICKTCEEVLPGCTLCYRGWCF